LRPCLRYTSSSGFHMPCSFNLFHAMHFTVYCMPGSPWCGQTFSSPMPCIRFYCNNHVVQIDTAQVLSGFSSGSACAKWKTWFCLSARGSGKATLTPVGSYHWPSAFKLCGRCAGSPALILPVHMSSVAAMGCSKTDVIDATSRSSTSSPWPSSSACARYSFFDSMAS
jgi:hypothetical protein